MSQDTAKIPQKRAALFGDDFEKSYDDVVIGRKVLATGIRDRPVWGTVISILYFRCGSNFVIRQLKKFGKV